MKVFASTRPIHIPICPHAVLAGSCQFQDSRNAATKTRYQAMHWYGQGYRVSQIIDICGCSRTSLREWCRAYKARGLSALVERCGFSYQRSTKQYKSRSEVKSMEFEEQLEKTLDTAQNAPQPVWLAGEEASLYLQASLMRGWSPTGQPPMVKADPGREMTPFYGTLNLFTGEEVVLRSDIMNAEVSALHLSQLLLAYPEVPILLLWDRAPWHRGPAVEAVLEANPRLEIIWLPLASPDLHPQEHVGKAAREAVSHNHTRTKLPELAEAFETHLTTNRFASSLLEQHNYRNLCAMFI